MADKSAAPASPPPADAKPKKSKKLLILGTLGFIVIAGGGSAAYWFTRQPPDPAAAKKVEEPEPSGIVTFEPFVVNLADGAGARFLRINIQLIVPGKEDAAAVDEDDVLKARLRSSLLELLASQTSDRLVSVEGKADLKKAIAERAAKIVAPHKVSDVLFTEFIVQF